MDPIAYCIQVGACMRISRSIELILPKVGAGDARCASLSQEKDRMKPLNQSFQEGCDKLLPITYAEWTAIHQPFFSIVPLPPVANSLSNVLIRPGGSEVT